MDNIYKQFMKRGCTYFSHSYYWRSQRQHTTVALAQMFSNVQRDSKLTKDINNIYIYHLHTNIKNHTIKDYAIEVTEEYVK